MGLFHSLLVRLHRQLGVGVKKEVDHHEGVMGRADVGVHDRSMPDQPFRWSEILVDLRSVLVVHLLCRKTYVVQILRFRH